MTKALLSLAQLERIKDIVTVQSGKLEIKIYTPENRDYFMISFEEGKATYRKVTACDGEQRETYEKIWPSKIVDVVTTPGVSTRMKVDFKEQPLWFDTNEDPDAFNKLYELLRELSPRV